MVRNIFNAVKFFSCFILARSGFLWTKDGKAADSEQPLESFNRGLCVFTGWLDILKIDKLHLFIVFHVSICWAWSFVWGG